MSVVVRNATVDDGQFAVPLLLEAGENLLENIFGNGDREKALDFLNSAWKRGTGQYGYSNHWVACRKDNVVGIITCWHDKLPENFDRDTLSSVIDYYGLDTSIDVVKRSQRYTVALNPPMICQLGVGHLAVDSTSRRQGVGSALLCFMEQKANTLGKLSLVLDVEESNEQAIVFYKSLGFRYEQHVPPFIQYVKAVSPD